MTMNYLMKLGCFIYGQETLGLHRCDRRRNLRVVVHFQGVIRHRWQKASALKSFLGSSILGEKVQKAVLTFSLDGRVSSMTIENNKQNSLEAISCCYLSEDVNDTIFLIIIIYCTEGALKLPTTYDNNPIQPNPIPSVRHIALNELNRPKIDLSRPSLTSNE